MVYHKKYESCRCQIGLYARAKLDHPLRQYGLCNEHMLIVDDAVPEERDQGTGESIFWHFSFKSNLNSEKRRCFLQFFFYDKNLDKLHEKVGKTCLPEEYGGYGGPIDYDYSMTFLRQKEEWFNNNISKKYGYIEVWEN